MKKKIWRRALAVLAAVILVAGIADLGPVRAEGTVTVTAATAKLRESATTSSNQVGSVKSGETLSVLGESNDESGMLWYQVSVNGKNGYIRSDLVKKGGEAAGATATTTTTTTEVTVTETSGGTTAMPAQGATVNKDKVNVRSKASTSSAAVDTATKGTAVTVVGQEKDSSGKTWYQVQFISNGSEVTGYIRSDFIELGELIAQEEPVVEETPQEEVPEEPQENVVVPDVDYELEYTTNPDGEYEWYLNDYTNSRRQKLNDLLSAQEKGNAGIDTLEGTVAKQKMIIIVLAVLLALFLVIITILFFKLRESGYEYDDDDDEDEEDEDDEEEEETPRRFTFKKRKFLSDDEDDEDEDDEEEEERPARRPVQKPVEQSRPRTVSPQRQPEVTYEPKEVPAGAAVADKTRKSRNFLVEDDEFEFEFLNLNDKK